MHSMYRLGQSQRNAAPDVIGRFRSASNLSNSNCDAGLLLLTRFTRLFAYGALSVVLVFYLTGLGLSESRIGLLLTLILLGDTVVSLVLTTQADRIGRRRMLVVGSLLMVGAGLAFAFTRNFFFLLIAGTIGVISPSGNEVGPFLSIEQAALVNVVAPSVRTTAFAWYTLTGSFATAIGSLCGGVVPALVDSSGATSVKGYRAVVIVYAILGAVLTLIFVQLSPATEVGASVDRLSDLAARKTLFGIGHSRKIVLRLSGLFALDSFGGGFVVQSLAAYWFYLRFGVKPASLGAIFFGANLLAGGSALLASRLASRFGLVRTMVFTHLPRIFCLSCYHLCPRFNLQSWFCYSGLASAKWTFRQAVLHDGSCSSRRAVRRSRHHGSGANHRRFYSADVCRAHVRQAALDQRSILHRGSSKDRLRLTALSTVREDPAA